MFPLLLTSTRAIRVSTVFVVSLSCIRLAVSLDKKFDRATHNGGDQKSTHADCAVRSALAVRCEISEILTSARARGCWSDSAAESECCSRRLASPPSKILCRGPPRQFIQGFGREETSSTAASLPLTPWAFQADSGNARTTITSYPGRGSGPKQTLRGPPPHARSRRLNHSRRPTTLLHRPRQTHRRPRSRSTQQHTF
jgi:hypothetical protein